MNSFGVWCIAVGMAMGAVFAVQAFRARPFETPAAYQKITAEKAKEMLDSGSAIVLDVRTEEEFAEAHIKDALLLPHDEITERAPEILPDKSQTLLVHCRTGVRSEIAAKALIEMGYTSVYDFGGIVGWPYETVK